MYNVSSFSPVKVGHSGSVLTAVCNVGQENILCEALAVEGGLLAGGRFHQGAARQQAGFMDLGTRRGHGVGLNCDEYQYNSQIMQCISTGLR